MQGQGQPKSQQLNTPVWMPPIQIEWLVAGALIVFGSNIETVPKEYHSILSHPLFFIFGMIVSVGLAAVDMVPLALAVAFFLVNVERLLPNKEITTPGKKEGFVPSGAIDWVTTQKKWFVEKVLLERPVAIQEKEVTTYPIHS
jgi:hypothetical protein